MSKKYFERIHIIRQEPGKAPEVLTGRLGTVGMKLLEAMPDRMQIEGTVTAFYDHTAEDVSILAWPKVAFPGTVYVACLDSFGNPTGIQDVDAVLQRFFHAVRYHCIDCHHNTWMCHGCGYITKFETDGPFENGWNVCPHCGQTIQHPRRTHR